MQRYQTPRQIEDMRKSMLIYAFSALGSIFVVLFAALSYLRQQYTLSLGLLAIVAVGALASWLLYRYRAITVASLFMAVVLFAMSIWLVIGGGYRGTGVYFAYPCSVLMILLLGSSAGLLAGCALLAMLAIGLYTPFFDSVMTSWHYPTEQPFRIIVAMTAQVSLVWAGEYIRMRSYGWMEHAADHHLRRALTDSLTGIGNREAVRPILEQWDKDAEHSVICVLDLDHFKSVNDRFGHKVGDEVLRGFAAALQANIKGRDIAIRWGGEEFLVLFSSIQLSDAVHLVEQLRVRFARRVFTAGEARFTVTFSAGLAVMNHASEFETAFRLADERLYRAKAQGRDCIVSV